MSAAARVDLAAIREAAATIRGSIVETPLTESRTLSTLSGARVWIKFENEQFTASFKERGALVKLSTLSATQRRHGVCAMSRGNHAQAVAYHAQRLGIPAVIVMPLGTPNIKVAHTRSFGAEVVLHGDTLEAANRRAHELATQRQLTFIHPYDDADVIRGQGTLALEMLAEAPELDALIIPVGGGGLIAGNAVAAQGVKPGIEIYGAETARYPSMKQQLAGQTVECGSATLADGIAVKQPGKLTLPIVRERVTEILLVDELALEEAVLLYLEVEKTVAEGAGAAPLAALLAHRPRFAGRNVGLVLSGGNIDMMQLSRVILRGLARSDRLVRFRVALRDEPGALAKVTAVLAQQRAGVIEVSHQRTFSKSPIESAEVEFVIETRGSEHVRAVLDALSDAGYKVVLPESESGE